MSSFQTSSNINHSNSNQQLNLVISSPDDTSLSLSVGTSTTSQPDNLTSFQQQQQLKHDTSQVRKPFKTEYKSKFTPFDQYVYNEVTDSFVRTANDLSLTSSRSNQNLNASLASPTAAGHEANLFAPTNGICHSSTEQEPWYKEVVRRKEQANEYRFKSEVGHNSPLLNVAQQQAVEQRVLSPLDQTCETSGNVALDSQPMDSTDQQTTQAQVEQKYKFTPSDYKRDNMIANMANNNNFSLPKENGSHNHNGASSNSSQVSSSTTRRALASARTTTRTAAQARSRSQSSRRPVTAATSSRSGVSSTQQQAAIKSHQTTPTKGTLNSSPLVSSTSRSGTTTARLRVTSTKTTTSLSRANNTSSTQSTATARSTVGTINKRPTTSTTPKVTNSASSKLTNGSSKPSSSTSSNLTKTRLTSVAPSRPTTGITRTTMPARTGVATKNTSTIAPRKQPNTGRVASSTARSVASKPIAKSNANSSKVEPKEKPAEEVIIKTPKAAAAAPAAAAAAATVAIKTTSTEETKDDKKVNDLVEQDNVSVEVMPRALEVEEKVQEEKILEPMVQEPVVESKAEEQFVMEAQQYVTSEEPSNLIFSTTSNEGNMLADELAQAEMAALQENLKLSTSSIHKIEDEPERLERHSNESGRLELSDNQMANPIDPEPSSDSDNKHVMMETGDQLVDDPLQTEDDKHHQEQADERAANDKLLECNENLMMDFREKMDFGKENEGERELDRKIVDSMAIEKLEVEEKSELDKEMSRPVLEETFEQQISRDLENRLNLQEDRLIQNNNLSSEDDLNLVSSKKNILDDKQDEHIIENFGIDEESKFEQDQEEENLDLRETGEKLVAEKAESRSESSSEKAFSKEDLVNGLTGGLISAEDGFDSSERELSVSGDKLDEFKIINKESGSNQNLDDQNSNDEPYSIMPTTLAPQLDHKEDYIGDKKQELDKDFTLKLDPLEEAEAFNERFDESVGEISKEANVSDDSGKQKALLDLFEGDLLGESLTLVEGEKEATRVPELKTVYQEPFEEKMTVFPEQTLEIETFPTFEKTTDQLLSKENSSKFIEQEDLSQTNKDINPDLLPKEPLLKSFSRSSSNSSIKEEEGEEENEDQDEAERSKNELLMNVTDLMSAESKIKQEMRRKSELARQNSSPQPGLQPQGELLLSPEELELNGSTKNDSSSCAVQLEQQQQQQQEDVTFSTEATFASEDAKNKKLGSEGIEDCNNDDGDDDDDRDDSDDDELDLEDAVMSNLGGKSQVLEEAASGIVPQGMQSQNGSAKVSGTPGRMSIDEYKDRRIVIETSNERIDKHSHDSSSSSSSSQSDLLNALNKSTDEIKEIQ